MLEIKLPESEAAAKIIVVGVGGAGNNAVNRMGRGHCRSRIYRGEYR